MNTWLKHCLYNLQYTDQPVALILMEIPNLKSYLGCNKIVKCFNVIVLIKKKENRRGRALYRFIIAVFFSLAAVAASTASNVVNALIAASRDLNYFFPHLRAK